MDSHLSRRDIMIIARHFNAGSEAEFEKVPKGLMNGPLRRPCFRVSKSALAVEGSTEKRNALDKARGTLIVMACVCLGNGARARARARDLRSDLKKNVEIQPLAEGVYDVAIVGGALTGAATAILLLEKQPGLRVLIMEKTTRFTRRVGEATVEVSAYFLSRVLGLTQHLNQEHLVKQGLRFWFANDRAEDFGQCSEIGGRFLARIPAYQVDRAVLDEEVLRRAVAAGAELWRPATVHKIALAEGGIQNLSVLHQDEARTIRARWVVDASGVAAIVARQNGWWKPNPAHPTTAVWSRWKGVKDWDGLELTRKYPEYAGTCYGIRGTATNHFMGDGWWAWCIPLKGGDYSIGVVFDQRLVHWPETGSLGNRLKEFLCAHPAAKELIEEAQWEEGDVHWRKNLPYSSSVYAGNGIALAGDAAGFLDPFYSPGMDWIAYTVTTTVNLILAERRGEDIEQALSRHNRGLNLSYERWFQALYEDKYFYLGDYELMRLAFVLDLGLYYLGVASQPYFFGLQAFSVPAFSNPPATPVFHFMRFYNRRLAGIAWKRRQNQRFGRRNHGCRFMFPGFTFNVRSGWPLVKALGSWAWLEIKEGWRSWRWKKNYTSMVPSPDPGRGDRGNGYGISAERSSPPRK
jgi:flavin-dependent dehydrogenase